MQTSDFGVAGVICAQVCITTVESLYPRLACAASAKISNRAHRIIRAGIAVGDVDTTLRWQAAVVGAGVVVVTGDRRLP